MPLRCGERLILRAEEKSVRPSMVISPSTIRRKPATASSKVVLPEPDGPKIAVIRESKDASMSSSKFASGIRQRSFISGLFPRAQQPLRAPDEYEGQCDGDSQQGIGFRVFAQLNVIIDCQRQRLCLAWDVSSQQDGCAEFAEGARKCEKRTCNDTFVRERNRDHEENP